MPTLTERIRDIFVPEDDRAEDPSGNGPPQPDPETRPVTTQRDRPAPRESFTQARDPAETLSVAQGQELLGPCRECDGYWTREPKRGQKPQTCPVCKREGPPND